MEIQNSNLSRAQTRELKIQNFGIVTSNRRIGEQFYKLKIEFSGSAAEVFKKFKAGQFVQIDLSTAALPASSNIPPELTDVSGRHILLRRPFSFTEVTSQKDKTIAELSYRVVGPATLRMTNLAPGDSLNVIGPLGNGFTVLPGKKTALLVIGGMGAPPIQCLAKVLAAEYSSIEVLVFAGAKTAKELPFERILDQISQQLGFSVPEFAKCGMKSQVATDDGSAGYPGLVTDCVSQWLEQHNPPRESTIIYGCGPEAMLARLAEIANKKNIDCQISMEREMACGFGVCQSCAIKCRVSGSSETIYKLCCKDGPVFESREVVFNE
jgi:dihydroorotate dehydrogenase electron transfer subunit